MKLEFGEWLKNEINKKGLTQSELAENVGVQPSQISRIISGERGTSPEVLDKISRVLRLTPETVYRAAGFLPTQVEKIAIIQQIDYIVKDLPREEQENILEYARLRQRIAEERGSHKTNEKRPTSHPGAS